MKNYRKFGPCAVCKNECKIDDDIVVCPECGTPYHRKCYESIGQCLYSEKHGEGYVYVNPNAQGEEAQPQGPASEADSKKCPRCLKENSKDSSFCSNCGCPLTGGPVRTTTFINGFPINPAPGFEPIFKINENETIYDIKISDFARYIKGNLLYYIPIFKNIGKVGKSRFNFSAFLFSGAWFLYRKLYKIGIIFTSLIIFLSVLSTFIEFTYANDILVSIFKSVGVTSSTDITLDKYDLILAQFYALPLLQKFIVFLPSIVKIITFAIMLFSGFCANRIYYKNCCSKIKKIKILCKGDRKLFEDEINKFGGVNFKIIPFISICYIIIEYLPRFLI